ncbi:carbohydrate ABC transporter permease [Amycolatopsis sp. GM8]|uniref:carbohydrate ABC transporter permease n=1 Tax=Amycolatopsis sp. GM8 TaxID=2896530 RepID=UPI001F267A96|nr:carbohydrate ABC transporter permease [Amycolatopsis sp. GM8]
MTLTTTGPPSTRAAGGQQRPTTTQPRRIVRSGGRVLATIVIVLVIIVAFLGPYIWMFASGLKTQNSIFTDVFPVSWKTFIPLHATIENVVELFTERDIGQALVNSGLVAGGQVLGALVVCCPAAYALTRIKFPGRNIIFALILATFMLPAEALALPMFELIGKLGIEDTLVGVGIPWIANAFGLFLLRQAFEAVPVELDEAARLDGAGHFRIFWSVVLPNVRADLVTFVLTIFLFSWNAFLWPLIAIQSPEKQLVQVAIAQSVAPGELPNWGLSFAGASIATIPLLVLFIFLQRQLIPGLARSGMK